MPPHKATLIQYIREYLFVLKEHLQPLLESFTYLGVTEEDALQWIIAEELELIYGLFTVNHTHNRSPYVAIHSCLAGIIPLSTITQAYIVAPKLYLDYNQIEIRVTEFDLFIYYYAHPSNQF